MFALEMMKWTKSAKKGDGDPAVKRSFIEELGTRAAGVPESDSVEE